MTGCCFCVSIGHSTETVSGFRGVRLSAIVPAFCLVDGFYQVMAAAGSWILLVRFQDLTCQSTAFSLARLILSSNIPDGVGPAISIA
jgi:hypothetical protein